MWLVRREQVRVLEKAALAGFERRAVEHLQRTLPARCAIMGPEAVLESVRDAIEKARAYGIESELDVLTFLNVTYILGFDFETQPRFAWATQVLAATDVQAAPRLKIILDRAVRELFP